MIHIIICVTFIQLGANIYDNPSYLKLIMKHISNTRGNRRLRKVAKTTVAYTVFVCLSLRYTSAHNGRILLHFILAGRAGIV